MFFHHRGLLSQDGCEAVLGNGGGKDGGKQEPVTGKIQGIIAPEFLKPHEQGAKRLLPVVSSHFSRSDHSFGRYADAFQNFQAPGEREREITGFPINNDNRTGMVGIFRTMSKIVALPC